MRVFSAPNSQISKAENAKIELGGNLWFGQQVTEDFFCIRGGKSQLILSDNSYLKTFGNCTIGGGSIIHLKNNAKLFIGDKTYIHRNCNIYVSSQVSIGQKCAISWNVTIIDSDFHPVVDMKKDQQNTMALSAPVTIEDHVWIGCNVTILKGVRIGENSVISAGAIVRSDVPANSMVGGNPAKILRENISWVL